MASNSQYTLYIAVSSNIDGWYNWRRSSWFKFCALVRSKAASGDVGSSHRSLVRIEGSTCALVQC